MYRNQKPGLVLATYLILFLNLGPSLHRAPIFGLHDHNRENVKEVQTCSCGCDHSSSQSEQDESPSDTSIETQACDCSVCEFFKYCQVDFAENPIAFYSDVLLNKPIVQHVNVNSISIPKRARGPPTA